LACRRNVLCHSVYNATGSCANDVFAASVLQRNAPYVAIADILGLCLARGLLHVEAFLRGLVRVNLLDNVSNRLAVVTRQLVTLNHVKGGLVQAKSFRYADIVYLRHIVGAEGRLGDVDQTEGVLLVVR
jgi:hypothetical protein